MNTNPLILIVEDNPSNMKLTADVLEYEGWKTVRAASAAEATGLLAQKHPDLILMDLNMPGEDGLTFTRRLREDPEFDEIPIIALTALAMVGDSRKALDAGCDGYITKPIDTRTLVARISDFLPNAEYQKGDSSTHNSAWRQP
ncbi:response regulator [bacterium]|nr:response regulator [bacterium]